MKISWSSFKFRQRSCLVVTYHEATSSLLQLWVRLVILSRLQDLINFIPDYPHTEFTQECKVRYLVFYFETSPLLFPVGFLCDNVNKLFSCIRLILQTKNANVLGFCWTNWNEIVFITDQGIEFYQVILTSVTYLQLWGSESLYFLVYWQFFALEYRILEHFWFKRLS